MLFNLLMWPLWGGECWLGGSQVGFGLHSAIYQDTAETQSFQLQHS